jgi:hypothetical protein
VEIRWSESEEGERGRERERDKRGEREKRKMSLNIITLQYRGIQSYSIIKKIT